MPILSPTKSPSNASLALSNLRGVVILIVLGFHSVLAYVGWVAVPTADFDSPPYNWRAFPIVDSHRFVGFDFFCAWQDVYLMSLMFFLSGLFVWSSLTRKTHLAFVRDRVLRLGIPYAFGIVTIIPLATYPAFRVTAIDVSATAYWHALLVLPFWPNGPLWFLWQLLVLNIIAAVAHWIAPDALRALGQWSAAAGTRVGAYFATLVVVSALAYVPLAVAYTPWTWSNSGPFAVQLCRPLHYAVYFFAGVGIGAGGIGRGLLAVNGLLARHWAFWLAAALASLMLWMGLTSLTFGGDAWMTTTIAADFSYVVACAAGCFSLIAISLRLAAKRSPILGVLAADAYALYLLHYVFAVWLQYGLLAMSLPAVLKAALVFGLTLLLTWLTATTVQRIPLGARLIGSPRHPILSLRLERDF
jgi:surface polysaccharide O-acyltransferase-like enzyme